MDRESDERREDFWFLTQQGIEWKFNLSRAPWWEGQFERLIGLVKGSLHKTIGNGFKMPSKTFALSKQMGGECWKNGLCDRHAVKVNFILLI